MHIQQFEQSGCIITSANGQALAIDIGALTPVEKLAELSVGAVLVSHIHADHCSAEQIQALNPTTIYTGAECAAALAETGLPITEITADTEVQIGDFTVLPFEVDHGPNAPRVPTQNFGFLLKVDEQAIYFAGDMFIPSGIPVNGLSVDAALLPVGGHFTFDAKAAFAFAQQFASIGIIYPMHYEAVGPIDTAGKEKFAVLAAGTFTIA
jgi:L-ascorbate metabolism protein UlaG (beta-lactamase superfamily)